MHKFYKQKIYKKYKDEIWGKLVLSDRFSYNKKTVLLNYRDKVVKSFIRLRSKYGYFREGFLKNLRYSVFISKKILKIKRIVNFYIKSFQFKGMRRVAPFVKKIISLYPLYKIIRRGRFTKKILIKRSKKRKPILKSHKNSRRVGFSKKKRKQLKFKNLLIYNTILLRTASSKKLINFFRKGKSNFTKSKGVAFLTRPSKVFSNFSLSNKIFKKYRYFSKANSLSFIFKKKFNLKNNRVFYYAVHIASPRKKIKKWSNYGLKMIYYRKISQFFGFKKVSKFLSFYKQSKSFWGNNESLAFLLLEGRLGNILFRANFFDSMYFLKRFIEAGNVYVNNTQITNSNHVVNLNQVISINKKYFKYLYFYLKFRLKKKKLLLNFPSYMEVDYKLFTTMLIRPPAFKELTRPVSFDLYTKFITIHK